MEKNIILILHYYLLNASYLHTVPLTSVQPGPSAAVQSRWITKMSVRFPYFIKAKSIFLFCSDNKSWRAESGVTWSPSAFWPSPLVGKTRQPKSACEFAPCVNACFPEWSKRWNVLCVGLLIRRGADQHSVIPPSRPPVCRPDSETCPMLPPPPASMKFNNSSLFDELHFSISGDNKLHVQKCSSCASQTRCSCTQLTCPNSKCIFSQVKRWKNFL